VRRSRAGHEKIPMRFALIALVYIVSTLWLVIVLLGALVGGFDLAEGALGSRDWMMFFLVLAGLAFPGVIGLLLAHRALRRDRGEPPRGPRGFDVAPPSRSRDPLQ
jgi:hypothetical protein